MTRTPIAVAAVSGLAGLAWAAAVLLEPGPFAPSSAVAIAAGFVVFGLLAMVGIGLMHAPWGRTVAGIVAGTGAVVAVLGDLGPVSILALALTAVALVGLTGPWLRGWLRRRPSATGPGPIPFTLILGLVALLPLTGMLAPAGLGLPELATAVVGPLTGVGYLRGRRAALWAARLVVPLLGLWAGLAARTPGGLVLAGITFVLAGLAWRREPADLLLPPAPPTPAPRPGRRPSGAGG